MVGQVSVAIADTVPSEYCASAGADRPRHINNKRTTNTARLARTGGLLNLKSKFYICSRTRGTNSSTLVKQGWIIQRICYVLLSNNMEWLLFGTQSFAHEKSGRQR